MTTITTTPQKAKVYAIFDNPPIVFACRVNQSFPTHDMVAEFIYDGVTAGAYTDVLVGMTVLLGSAPGLSDKGITYVRKAITSSVIYNGETSETVWANDLYVSVLQDWGIWVEYLRIATDQTVYMKYDVAYSDQHTKKLPVPIMGPDRVIRYEGAAVSLSFTGAASYAPGSSVASHSWACAGATVTNGSTATPGISFATPGRYVVQYTVTSAQSVSNTTYRTVHVWSDQDYVVGGVTKTIFPVTEIALGSLSGDFDAGGWTFSVNTVNDASAIRNRSKVILFSEEWYGDTKISYGQYVGAENVIAIGWVSDEQITIDDAGGDFQVTVQGPQYWLNQVYNFIPMGIEYSASPTSWTQMAVMTVDNVLWNLFVWRSTLVNCCDLFLTGDTRTAIELTASPGSMWEQVKEIAYTSILAAPCCNRYGQVFIEIETVLLSNSGRSGVPNKGTITHDDCESIGIERVLVTPTSQVVLSGVVASGSVGSAKFSMSRGHIPMRYGTPMKMERLLLSTQALSNELAGNLLEKANTQYRFVFNNLLYNNRLVDICPRQFIAATIEAADNPRGIAYNGNAIVKHIDLNFEEGSWSITWDAVPETLSVLSMDGDIPADPGVAPWAPPEFPPIDYPSIKLPKLPPITLPLPPNPKIITPLGIITILIAGKGLWALDTINNPTYWFNVTTPFDWTLEELASIVHFEVDPFGKAFINDATRVWSQLVAFSTARSTLIGIGALNTYLGGGATNGRIQAVGINPSVADGFAIFAGNPDSYYENNKMFAIGTAVSQTYNWGIGKFYANSGSMSYYNGLWYLSITDAWLDFKIRRFNGTLSALDAGVSSYDAYNPGLDVHHHPTGADYLYFSKKVFTTLGMTPSTIYPQEPMRDITSDPTGQYMFSPGPGPIGSYRQSLYKSANFGVTWTIVTTFPSLNWDGSSNAGNTVFPYVSEYHTCNMGDANKWLVSFTGRVYDSITHYTDFLQLWYTSDFGVTWVSYAKNLPVVVPETSVISEIRFG